ncbi:MAG: hypothetical protein OJJ21_07950 [Ferrovibrio sp.]|uniref:hypothetical protein n=1 Tax=Ferrovibrio sp. TaxID=1917215 RepID=UPI0026041526|nr:hypothetical protein [Ferrovibrio sp.]MCW0233514.1 hypothetical protein [Ferrovibrio sp.]
MDAVDIVSALLPSLLMFFAVSLGANSLERYVFSYARGRFQLDQLVSEAEQLRNRMAEIRVDYDKLQEDKARLELHLSERQNTYGGMMAREVEFSDARNMVIYEVGTPRPHHTGWYVKLIGPEMHEMFSGPGSGVSAFPGRRTARVVMWGIEDEHMARLRTKKIFGALSEVMLIRPFNGKIRLGDV